MRLATFLNLGVLVLTSSLLAEDDKRNPVTQSVSAEKVRVRAVRTLDAIRYEVTSTRYGVMQTKASELKPGDGRCFVAVELATLGEDKVVFNDSALILTDTAGADYLPFGAEPASTSGLSSYRTFEDARFSIDVFSGTGLVSIERKQKGSPVATTMSGTGAACIFYFEVSAQRKGSTLRTPDGRVTALSSTWEIVPAAASQRSKATTRPATVPATTRRGPHIAAPTSRPTSEFPDPASITVEPLGQIPPGVIEDTLTVSPDRKHVACVARRGSQWSVFVDGVAGHQYDAIADAGLVFSSDGSRFAYAARKGKEYVVVTDGIESKGYDVIGRASLLFAPDGKRLAFIARLGQQDYVVINGAESNPYQDGVAGLAFCSDSKRLAYVAGRDGRQFVVIDGVEKKAYEGLIFAGQAGEGVVFSQDGRRFAYAAMRGSNQIVVVDDTESKAYDSVWLPVFSPDGRHVAFVAKKADRYLVVADGVEHRDYDEVGQTTLLFSPDSNHLAYGTKRGQEQVVVVDQIEHTPYEGVYDLVFSGESNRLAYIAKRGEQRVLLVDRVETASYNNIEGLTFSPDGKRIAYGARRGTRWCAVVDGLEGKEYDGVGVPVFSPDGKSIAYVAKRAGQLLIVINKKELEVPGRLLRDAQLVFDTNTSLRTLWHANGTIFRAHIRIR